MKDLQLDESVAFGELFGARKCASGRLLETASSYKSTANYLYLFG